MPEKKPKKEIALRVISIILGIFFVVGLIIIKINVEEFPLGWTIFGVALSVVFFTILFFIFEISNKIKNLKKSADGDEKLPAPITPLQAYEIVEDILKSPRYADYIDEVIDEGTEELGETIRSQVYSIYFTGKYTKQKYIVALNCHFPSQKRRIKINPTPTQIAQIKQLVAKYPEKAPNIKITEEENPLIGTKRKITEKTKPKEDKEGKKEDKGDI